MIFMLPFMDIFKSFLNFLILLVSLNIFYHKLHVMISQIQQMANLVESNKQKIFFKKIVLTFFQVLKSFDEW